MTKRRSSFFVAALALIALCMTSARAHAHVTLEPEKAAAGAYAKLTFRVPHGCERSATTKITVQIPEGTLSVKPQVHAGWNIKTKTVKLASPATLHGKEVTESISEVTWQGGVLEDQYMDEFGISLKLPEKPVGKVLFPVIQTCKKGENRWEENPPAEHVHHSKFPAPFLVLEASTAPAGH